MIYLVVRTSLLEVSSRIEADSPEQAAKKFDKLHEEATPIVRETTQHPLIEVQFEPMDQSVWDPNAEDGADPLWEVDF